MVGDSVQSAAGCRIQIQSVGPAVVGLIRVVAPAVGGRGAPCASFPTPSLLIARRQDGPQANLLLGQVLRRALRVPVSSVCGGGPAGRSDPVVGTRCPVEASVRPGKPRFVSRFPGFAGARESGSSAAAAPQPGADDRTRRPPGRARRGSTGGCTDGNLRGSVGVTLGALSKSFKMKLKTRGCPGKGFFFFLSFQLMLNC